MKNLKKFILIFLLLSISIGNASNLKSDIESILSVESLDNSLISLSVFSLSKDSTLIDMNGNLNLIPASLNKLITTGTALQLLGRDYKFPTRLYLDGNIDEKGEYIGNIYVRAYGDPSLNNYNYQNPNQLFDDWCMILDSIGIKSIKGNLIGDDDYFDDEYYPSGWFWDDLKYGYSAQINALSIYNNKVTANIISSKTLNENANIVLSPETDYLRVYNKVLTQVTKINVLNFKKSPYSNFVDIIGTTPYLPSQKDTNKLEISVNNPTLYFLNFFYNTIKRYNIRFKGNIIDIDDWNQRPVYFKMKEIASNYSIPLFKIIKDINTNSNNIAAEMLVKVLAKENTGIGNHEIGIRIIEDFLIEIGIDEKLYLNDGSGLSRLNLYSSSYLTNFLRYLLKSEIKNDILNSMATPGKGTFQRRLLNQKNKNNIYLKSGSMQGVSNVAGYLKTKSGQELVFTMMFNNFLSPINDVNNIQDLILMRLLSE